MTDNSEEMNRDWAFDSFTSSIRQLHNTDPWLKELGEQLLGELSRVIRHSEYAQTPVDVSQILNQLASLRSSIDVPSFQAARTSTYDALKKALDATLRYTKGDFRTDRDRVSSAMTAFNQALWQERQDSRNRLVNAQINARMLVPLDEIASGRLATFVALQTSLWQLTQESFELHDRIYPILNAVNGSSKQSYLEWHHANGDLQKLLAIASSNDPGSTVSRIHRVHSIFSKIFDPTRPYTSADMINDIGDIGGMQSTLPTGTPGRPGEPALPQATSPQEDLELRETLNDPSFQPPGDSDHPAWFTEML